MTVLKKLVISDFRSIRGEVELDLDSPVILLHGLNGYGKTSIISAIELGLTGSISFLRGTTSGHDEYLHHTSAPSGFVHLEAGLDGAIENASYKLSGAGAAGSPILSALRAREFEERCLLAQTSLGRFLDDSAPSGIAGDESPLVRFVKETLGLDALDAIIEGLSPSNDTRNARRISRPWTASKARAEALGREQTDIKKEIRTLEKEAKQLLTRLSNLLESPSEAPLDEARSLLSVKVSPVVDLSVEIAALKLNVRSAQRGDIEKLDAATALLDSARAAYESRLASESPFIRAALRDAGQFAETAPDLEDELLLEEFDEVFSELVVVSSALATANEEAKARQTSRLLAENNVSIAKRAWESARLSVQTAAADLSGGASDQALSLLIEDLSSDSCPVCDQKFDGDLRKHVANKIRAYARRATVYQEAVKAERIASEILDEARRHALSQQPDPAAKVHDEDALTNLVRRFGRIERSVELIRALRIDVENAIKSEERVRSLVSIAASVQSDLVKVEAALKLPTTNAPLRERVERAESTNAMRVRTDHAAAKRRDQLVTYVEDWERLSGRREKVSFRETFLLSQLEALESAMADAEARKTAAKGLRHQAQSIRSSRINQVFDQTLNATWSNLFQRLAPDERFTPGFKKQTVSSRTVGVELATTDRNGTQAGPPTSMLSFGNANTAALTLFLSLHFASMQAPPLLVLDDPVQSMDDLHVANFAALLRRIALEHDRQVLVAVHERALFDYLRMELAPSTHGQRVAAYSLERLGSRTVAIDESVSHTVDKSVRDSAVAS